MPFSNGNTGTGTGWRALRVALFALGVLAGASRAGAQTVRVVPVKFALQTLEGDTVRLGVGAPPTVVAVFATWCRSCKDEVVFFNRLRAELSAASVQFVALSADEAPAVHVQRWLDAYHATYPVARDTSGAAFRMLGVVGVPEIHVVAGDGRIVYSRRGPIASQLAALRTAVSGVKAGAARQE